MQLMVQSASTTSVCNAVWCADGICVANDQDNKRCSMLVHQISRLTSPSSLIVKHDAATFPEIYLKEVNVILTIVRNRLNLLYFGCEERFCAKI